MSNDFEKIPGVAEIRHVETNVVGFVTAAEARAAKARAEAAAIAEAPLKWYERYRWWVIGGSLLAVLVGGWFAWH